MHAGKKLKQDFKEARKEVKTSLMKDSFRNETKLCMRPATQKGTKATEA